MLTAELLPKDCVALSEGSTPYGRIMDKSWVLGGRVMDENWVAEGGGVVDKSWVVEGGRVLEGKDSRVVLESPDGSGLFEPEGTVVEGKGP